MGMPAIAALIVLAMIAGLAKHGEGLLRAASQLTGVALATALGLSLIHRVINAAGWGLVLRAMSQSLRTDTGIRLWPASEACRWLPGSLWSYGSRAFLATRYGVPLRTATASLVLEIVVTVAGWVAVAGIGWGSLRRSVHEVLAHLPDANQPTLAIGAVAVVTATLAVGLFVGRSSRLQSRLTRCFAQLGSLRQSRLDPLGLGAACLFYFVMGIFNGLIFLVLVRAAPCGATVPAVAAIASNAVGWLACRLRIS
jgi:hypothetical protein